MWLDPNADGCVYDTVDCYHDCQGCEYAYPHFGGGWPHVEDQEEVGDDPEDCVENNFEFEYN